MISKKKKKKKKKNQIKTILTFNDFKKVKDEGNVRKKEKHKKGNVLRLTP